MRLFANKHTLRNMNVSNISLHLLMISIFSGAFAVNENYMFLNGPVLFSTLAFLLLAAARKIRVHKTLGYIIIALVAHSIITDFLGYGQFFWALNPLLSFSIMSIAFYSAVSQVGLEHSVQIYIKYVIIVSIIGIIQAVSFLAGFEPGYNYSFFANWVLAPGGLVGIRVNGILFEPSQVAFTCGFAIVLAVFRLLGNRQPPISFTESCIIIVFSVLSGSSVVFSILLLAFIIASTKRAIAFLLAVIFVSIIATQVTEDRFSEVFERFQGLANLYLWQESISDSNTSVYSLFVHTNVAFQNFLSTHGIGSGLGSHAAKFLEIERTISWDRTVKQLGTAGNLFNRLISELGMIGVSLLIILAIQLVKVTIRQKTDIISIATAVAIFAFVARNGTYSYYGLSYLLALLLVRPTIKNVPFYHHRPNAEYSHYSTTVNSTCLKKVDKW